jgi:hypothetical protein
MRAPYVALNCRSKRALTHSSQLIGQFRRQRGAACDDLACVMESDWRAREIERSAGRHIIVPGDRAVIDPEIADRRNQEPAGHGVDERGQRLIVSSSRILIALKACVGIALSQPGRPNVAGTGGGSFPSSSGGQRNLSVIGSLLFGTALALGWLACPQRLRASTARSDKCHFRTERFQNQPKTPTSSLTSEFHCSARARRYRRPSSRIGRSTHARGHDLNCSTGAAGFPKLEARPPSLGKTIRGGRGVSFIFQAPTSIPGRSADVLTNPRS